MNEIPEDVLARRDEFCDARSRQVVDLRGWGVDGYVWQTDEDSIVKVCRRQSAYTNERDVYFRLRQRQLYQLQGFRLPKLLDFDDRLLTLELTYIRPPYLLDFGAAALDQCPPGFDPYDHIGFSSNRASSAGTGLTCSGCWMRCGTTGSTTPTSIRRIFACGRSLRDWTRFPDPAAETQR